MLGSFGKRKSTPVLGLDISSTTVKLLELSHNGDRYRVESYGVVSLPVDAVIEKSVHDVNGVANAVRTVVTQSKSKLKTVAAAVAGSSVITKIAELSALEASGQSEIVSQPKVITGDKENAIIKSGTEVPYQEASASGETTTSFKEAVLALDVTPNITPDDRIMLKLKINQDSIGGLVAGENGAQIPTIDTTELSTNVLVKNGETIVLGGVFRSEDVESTDKVPFFGDLPYVGALFSRHSVSKNKNELLIFITPRILADTLID